MIPNNALTNINQIHLIASVYIVQQLQQYKLAWTSMKIHRNYLFIWVRLGYIIMTINLDQILLHGIYNTVSYRCEFVILPARQFLESRQVGAYNQILHDRLSIPHIQWSGDSFLRLHLILTTVHKKNSNINWV